MMHPQSVTVIGAGLAGLRTDIAAIGDVLDRLAP
jgi:succinate dehydrogenase/fumarate reductase flavoprotein subunit